MVNRDVQSAVRLHDVVFSWLKQHSSDDIAQNCELPKQLDHALKVLQMNVGDGGHHQGFSKRVESMSMALHLLQEMISNESELEVEHWLIRPLNPDSAARRREATNLLM